MLRVMTLAALGAGLWAGYRALKREQARVARELETTDEDGAQARAPRPAAAPRELVRDPATGVYRPRG